MQWCMKTKIILLSTAAVLVAGGLIVTQTSAADSSASGAIPLRGQILKRIAEKLELTSNQKSQFKTILLGEKETLKTLLGQLHDARKNLRAAIQTKDTNESSVRAASAKVASIEADLAVERMKVFGKIAPELTQEQRQKISDFAEHMDTLADGFIAHIGDGLAE